MFRKWRSGGWFDGLTELCQVEWRDNRTVRVGIDLYDIAWVWVWSQATCVVGAHCVLGEGTAAMCVDSHEAMMWWCDVNTSCTTVRESIGRASRFGAQGFGGDGELEGVEACKRRFREGWRLGHRRTEKESCEVVSWRMR